MMAGGIELRILSGARAGQQERFEKPVVAVGRHPQSDLRFDAQHDLDVSTKHAEIRGIDGTYAVHDLHSTNGTFVNGQRVTSSRVLADGDVIGFGALGPTVAVKLAARRATAERVAIAVREETRGLKILVVSAVVVLGGLALGAYWIGHREAAARDAEIQRLLAANEQATREFQTRLQSMDDTALTNSLRRKNDSLQTLARQSSGAPAQASIQAALQRNHDFQRALIQMDLPAVRDANDPAIVLIQSDVGQGQEATGFCVRPSGLIVTNRHVIAGDAGRASRVIVKFADTRDWIPARIVRVGADVDLALLQLDRRGTYPAVRGVAPRVDVPVGSAIATLGFPLGTDLPMEGAGDAARAATTLSPGTITKSITDLLQIDAFAQHGSSGSPVLDARGLVIGVVYGGPTGVGGRIVYAVPSPRIVELINGR
jgi:S1-C subfamily serine protease